MFYPHLEVVIRTIKGLDVNKAYDLTTSACNAFYNNMQTLYDQHKYNPYYIWNLNEIGV
jgi:hypothetical protein